MLCAPAVRTGISNRLRRPAYRLPSCQITETPWFTSVYAPELLAVVYLGDDHNKPLPAGGGARRPDLELTL